MGQITTSRHTHWNRKVKFGQIHQQNDLYGKTEGSSLFVTCHSIRYAQEEKHTLYILKKKRLRKVPRQSFTRGAQIRERSRNVTYIFILNIYNF